ncbi:MAG TPA: DUF1972 domain-containing protein [Terrimicrobiaceae bacterium]
MTPRKLKIAFLGSRGIPRCYSGFETFVEEISVRLARIGHDVTVYNRVPFNKFRGGTFEGVRIVRLPTIPAKGTDTLVHSALSTSHSLLSRFDAIYYCGVGSSIFSLPARLRGAKTVVNVDGADWERAKWGRMGKTWLKWSERMAARFADSVIADHPRIQERYRKQFGIECALIPYGADVVESDPGIGTLQRFNLIDRGYFLYVSRLTPENRADLVMEAYLASEAKTPLIVVGDAPYVSAYLKRLRALADQSNGRIRMIGYQFGDDYRQLSFHARAFIFPTTIEATRPVLLEQMGMGAHIIACDTPANRHILGNTAEWFSNENPKYSLSQLFRRSAASSSCDSESKGQMAQERIRRLYSWDTVARQYHDLFVTLTHSCKSDPASRDVHIAKQE